MSNLPQPTSEQGGVTKTEVVNHNVEELLYDILQELKIMNLHNDIITDTEFTTNDI